VGHLLWFREQTVKLSCLQVKSQIVTAHELNWHYLHSGRKFSFANEKWCNISVQLPKHSQSFFAKSSSTFLSLKSKLTLTSQVLYLFYRNSPCRSLWPSN